MTSTKVSVIMPVYNVAPYLRQSLDSVVNQTLKEIEIICIDDCSTDDSWEILQEYALKDNRIILLKQEFNQGPGAARNRGLDIASGEYIMFLDPDDWFELDACEICYKQIKTNDNDFVIFAHNNYFQENGETTYNDSMLEPFKEELYNRNIMLNKLDTNVIDTAFCWSLICKKEFLDKFEIRFPNYRNYEDQVFFVKVHIYAKTISVIKKSLYTYRINKTSSCFVYRNQHEDLLKSKKEILLLADQLDDNSNIKKSIYVHLIESILYWFKRYSAYSNEIEQKIFYNMKELFSYTDEKYVEEIIKPRLNNKAYRKYLAVNKCNNIFMYKTCVILMKIGSIIFR